MLATAKAFQVCLLGIDLGDRRLLQLPGLGEAQQVFHLVPPGLAIARHRRQPHREVVLERRVDLFLCAGLRRSEQGDLHGQGKYADIPKARPSPDAEEETQPAKPAAP